MNTKHEELRVEALRKAAIYQRLFLSEEGQVILADLRAEFDAPPLVNTENPHLTFVRAGELKVLRYIDEVLQVNTMEVDPNA